MMWMVTFFTLEFIHRNVTKFSVLEGLFNKTALQEYILYAAQHPAGGLRDKPPKLVSLVSWAFKT